MLSKPFTMYIRFLSLSFLLLFSGLNLNAQTSIDSLAIVKHKWSKQKIAKGLVWKQASFDGLFESQQEVNILELDLNKKHFKVDIAGLSKGLIKTSELANKEHAIGAINGSFFDTRNGGSVTYIRQDGEVINLSTMNKNGEISERANAALVIDEKNNLVSIVSADEGNIKWEEQLSATDVMVCGPLLIMDNVLVSLQDNPFNKNRHPRSAVALTADNKLLLITVDGRNKHAEGMNLDELAYFLKIIGSTSAFNLDGGGSTTLYIDSKKKSGIVNYPSDNKLFDHEGERPVANIVLIKKN